MASPEECSQEVLATIPLIMRTIRREVRREHKPDLSVPQFRTLAFLYHEPGASLSQVAEFVGLMLPSMSKIVDGLVERGLVARETCPEDRRRLGLTLTAAGKSLFMVARRAARARLAEILRPLSASDRAGVVNAMRNLREVVAASEQAAQQR
ncbi:MAG: MarR family transcriptional regulator [Planctomycetota bacterium]|nr:MarR family transcriptional regulator [Planctomycetota bacterium]